MQPSDAMSDTRGRAGYTRSTQELPPGDRPVPEAASHDSITSPDDMDDAWCLQKAVEIYTTSTDYLESNVTRQWERNLAHFRSEHSNTSRYRRQDWKRSRTFRPKTRANVKSQESSAATAVFSTEDLVDIQPVLKTNQQQIVSAAVHKALLQYRLEKTMPWFLTVVGAYQDTKVYGLCISYQDWHYQATENLVPATDEAGNPVLETDPDTGEQIPMGRAEKAVLVDEPISDLVEPENFRFDPMCDWRNPAKSSPYIVFLRPMYAIDVMDMMELDGDKAWRKHSLGAVVATRRETMQRTRQAREGRSRVDPADASVPGQEFTMVWAHLNIIRVKGVDYAWWTLGTELMMTDPVPLAQMYPWLKPRERPFTIGYSTIEAHRNYPAGDVEQSAPLQEEINDIANQRMDNVKLVLNKRYFIRRGSQVDLDALMRNVPGGGVMINDPEKDVEVVSTPDVTASSYQEQDRLATDFDELVGGFSQNSVQQNNKVANSGKGLQQVAGAAGAVQDYGTKIFFETWLEPTLRQLQRLIAYYENDEKVLAIAAEEAQMFQRFGVDQITDELLEQELTVQVNVAVGNTDPLRRVERLTYGVGQAAGLPGMPERLKSTAIANEIFGALGFKDSSRFFMNDEELQAEQERKGPPPPPPEIAVKQMELEIRKADNDARHQREAERLELDREIKMMELALKEKLTLEQMYTTLGIKQAELKTKRDTTALQEANRLSEMNMKRTQGEGI